MPRRNSTRDDAITFCMSVLRQVSDWQEGQDALYQHQVFGPWLREQDPDSPRPAQSIISEAEQRLGDDLPDGYSD